jgi:L-ascorbate metabolism protein UlaG (beta-lactamase superfamily)
MRLIKYTHAAVRLEQDGRTILLDPGIFTEDEAYDGVSHILVTHEHADHVSAEKLAAHRERQPDLEVYTSAAVAAQLGEALRPAVRAVEVGDKLTVNGFGVEAVGGRHAEIYEGLPGCANIGFIVDGVYHPGDALHVPSSEVATLLVPTAAPWLKLAEGLDFVRAVKPARAFSIHDAMLSRIGEAGVDGWMRSKGQTEYARIPVGSSVEV